MGASQDAAGMPMRCMGSCDLIQRLQLLKVSDGAKQTQLPESGGRAAGKEPCG